MTPTKPGFYWALWLKASPGTHEGEELAPARDWEVVELWANTLDPYADEPFGVSVPGVRESQWPEDFKWGELIVEPEIHKTYALALARGEAAKEER